MSDDFMLLPVSLMKQQMISEVRKCNEFTSKYGLILSDQEIGELADNRKESLESSGRIELMGGVIKKIILEFADSPYIYQDNYLEILTELQECFYYFKNESLDELSDDELIYLMKKHFDDDCQGSVEFLQTALLENYSRDIRYRTNEYRDMAGYEDDYREFLDVDEE